MIGSGVSAGFGGIRTEDFFWGSSDVGRVVSSPPRLNALAGLAAYRPRALRSGSSPQAALAAQREPCPKPASAGRGATLTVAEGVNHTPPVPLKRAGGKPDTSMRRQNTPHLRNAVLGTGLRHAATGSAQKTGAPARPTGPMAALYHCDGMNPRRSRKRLFLKTDFLFSSRRSQRAPR
jgi:hypothetical protein